MSSASIPGGARTVQAGLLVALASAALAFLPLHGGRWFPGAPDEARAWLAALLVAAWCWASVAIVSRARRDRRALGATVLEAGQATDPDEWLVVHASQTGQAVEIAARTVDSLRHAGLPARLRDIASLDARLLAGTPRVLFVASTSGEGDAPDAAAGFIDRGMEHGTGLSHLRYAVLALGDRDYRNYCAFGHRLDGWLRGQGAVPMFDLVEVDNGDPAALRHWQHQLAVVSGSNGQPDWAPVAYQRWTLAARRVLNPGSAGAPVFEVRLAPPAGSDVSWRAGDIAELGPRQAPAAVDNLLAALSLDASSLVRVGDQAERLGDLLSRSRLPQPGEVRGLDAQSLAARLQPLPSREYSIASVPEEGGVQLLLRRMLRPDGTPGIGSGWLCDHALPGTTIDLRLRANPGFHGPSPEVPMILVGNGTGIAGLRAHLAERIGAGASRNWLLFGERHADRDFHLREDILRWLDDGMLERLDLAFSRSTQGSGLPAADASGHRASTHRGYVQDALRSEVARLREWIDAGAVVAVCGSLQGMAPGVDAALREALGDDGVEGLRATGRYRRDVY